MRSNRTTFPARAAVATLAVLTLAACGGDESDPAAAPDDTSPAAAEEAPDDGGATDGAVLDAAVALEDAVLRLEGISYLEPELFVLDDPFLEYDASVEMYTLTIDSLAEVRASFPDADEMPATAAPGYVELLDHLDDWSALAATALEQLEARRSELEPLTVEWALAEGDPGPPPAEYADIVLRNPEAFEEFSRRCTEFAVDADIAVNCFGTPAPSADGTIEFAVGDVTLSVDPGPIDEFIVRPDFFGADLDSADQMTIGAPFPVRNPAAAVENDATESLDGAPLDRPVPWPDDIDAYLADSPFEVTSDATVSTPSGDFRRLTIAQDEVAELSFIDLPPAPVVVRSSQPLVVWIGEIEGQTIVATLQAKEQSVEAFVAQVEEALMTLRPVG